LRWHPDKNLDNKELADKKFKEERRLARFPCTSRGLAYLSFRDPSLVDGTVDNLRISSWARSIDCQRIFDAK
jgi:hypothetical protein